MSIQLPSRKWYTLEQAAAKLTREAGEPVTVEDLLHFAYTGDLELCVYATYTQNELRLENAKINPLRIVVSDDELIEFNINPLFRIVYREDLSNGEESKCIKQTEFEAKCEGQCNYTITEDEYYMSLDGKYNVLFFQGLVSIPFLELSPVENEDVLLFRISLYTINKKTVSLSVFELPRENNDFSVFVKNIDLDAIDLEVADNFNAQAYIEINVPKNSILISNKELELLKNGGKKIDKINRVREYNKRKENKVMQKTLNRQAEFIRDLLAIQYGEDYPNKIRRELDNANSEIRKDFETKGLTPPSGKTVEKWLNK